MVDDWLALRDRGDQVLMLATERATVADINHLARARLVARGDLPKRSRAYRAPDDHRTIPLAVALFVLIVGPDRAIVTLETVRSWLAP